MAIGDIFRLAVEGLGPNAQQVVSVYHYRQVTALGQDTGSDLCDAWVEDVLPSFVATIADDCLVTRLEARNVNQPTLGFDRLLTPAVPGTLVGEVLPSMSAAVIGFRTGFIGKSFRGRVYVWPTTEAQQNLTQWVPGYLAVLETFAANLDDITLLATGANYRQVVYSKKLLAAKDVTSHVIDPIIGTQTRRRPGRGA